MARDPERCERISIANATQLIRDAGYSEKADLLDDMLQDDDIEVDDELPRNTLGTASKVELFFGRLSEEIALNPARVLRRCTVITRSDPRIITLALVLHHEADHILCDDELAAFGREHLAAYKAPKTVYLAKDFPRTKNGKILRRDIKPAIATAKSGR